MQGLQPMAVTRFAPSPTGELHLGHVAHAAWVWGAASAMGARVIVRIEDHDKGRSRREYETALLADLGWLGFPTDDPSVVSLAGTPSPYRQSDVEDEYQTALERLNDRGLVYGCDCSRSTIAAQLGDGVVEGEEVRYPGTCRVRNLPLTGHGVRVRLPEDAVVFDDLRLGRQTQRPATQCGDLLIRDRAGQWTYQFAVTVDDQRNGITLVIRGEDLLASTGRQILLARLLGRIEPPTFLHHPLILNESGAKLGKRNRSLSLAALRAAGRTPTEILGEALHRTGMLEPAAPTAVSALGELFRNGRVVGQGEAG